MTTMTNRCHEFCLVTVLSYLMLSAMGNVVAAEGQFPSYARVTGFVNSSNLPQETPSVLWKYDSDGVKTVSLTDAVVADGCIFFGDAEGKLLALNTKDGSVVWMHQHRERISNTPSVDKHHVYFSSANGITAVQRSDGSEVWHFEIAQGASETTPIPLGDRVYSSGYDGMCYAVNSQDGEMIWEHNLLQDVPSDPKGFDGQRARFGDKPARPRGSACDGEIFLQGVFDQSRVVAIDCRTGKRRWSFQAKGWIGPAPTIMDDLVFVASQDKHLYCLNKKSGQVEWTFKADSWLSSRPAGRRWHCLLAVQSRASLSDQRQDWQTGSQVRRPKRRSRNASVFVSDCDS